MQRLIDANTASMYMTYPNYGVIQQLKGVPTVLTIPDNPTNGDVLKAIFGYVEERLDNPYNNKIVGVFLDGHRQVFLKGWWNSPYKNTKGE